MVCSKRLINNKSIIGSDSGWHRLGDKPFFEPMMVRSLKHICLTRPHWVKQLTLCWCSFAFSLSFWRYWCLLSQWKTMAKRPSCIPTCNALHMRNGLSECMLIAGHKTHVLHATSQRLANFRIGSAGNYLNNVPEMFSKFSQHVHQHPLIIRVPLVRLIGGYSLNYFSVDSTVQFACFVAKLVSCYQWWKALLWRNDGNFPW